MAAAANKHQHSVACLAGRAAGIFTSTPSNKDNVSTSEHPRPSALVLRRRDAVSSAEQRLHLISHELLKRGILTRRGNYGCNPTKSVTEMQHAYAMMQLCRRHRHHQQRRPAAVVRATGCPSTSISRPSPLVHLTC